MGRVEKLCPQDAQHCCSLWPPRTLVQFLCFKISSMWRCTESPCSILSMGTVPQIAKKKKKGRLFLTFVPTRVRHEKRNQSRASGLCLRYLRNNSPRWVMRLLADASRDSHRPLRCGDGQSHKPCGRLLCPPASLYAKWLDGTADNFYAAVFFSWAVLSKLPGAMG